MSSLQKEASYQEVRSQLESSGVWCLFDMVFYLYSLFPVGISFFLILKPCEGLSIENTMWMNTVLATGNALGLVIYTGADTRSVMNTSVPDTKVGIIDMELNSLSKVCCNYALAYLTFLAIVLLSVVALFCYGCLERI
jgi:magnesium-transporting ATPase (P-type)